MLAKVIAWAPTREQAARRLADALAQRPDPRRRHQPRPAGRDPARRGVPRRRGEHRLPRPTASVDATAPPRPAVPLPSPPRSRWPSRPARAPHRPARHPGRLAQRGLASRSAPTFADGDDEPSSSGTAAATATSSTGLRRRSPRARTSVTLRGRRRAARRTTWRSHGDAVDVDGRDRPRPAAPACRGSPTRPTRWRAAACSRRCPAPSSASPSRRAPRSRPASRCWSSRR